MPPYPLWFCPCVWPNCCERYVAYTRCKVYFLSLWMQYNTPPTLTPISEESYYIHPMQLFPCHMKVEPQCTPRERQIINAFCACMHMHGPPPTLTKSKEGYYIHWVQLFPCHKKVDPQCTPCERQIINAFCS